VLFYVFLCCSMYCLFSVVLCIVCVYMCTVLLPPGGYPIAVKYILYYSHSNWKDGLTNCRIIFSWNYNSPLVGVSDSFKSSQICYKAVRLAYEPFKVYVSVTQCPIQKLDRLLFVLLLLLTRKYFSIIIKYSSYVHQLMPHKKFIYILL